MPAIRLLGYSARQMQRLGYLKRLIRRVTASNTSSLENLGHDLINTVTRKVRVELDAQRANYIKIRLYDRTYRTLKQHAKAWLEKEKHSEATMVAMELQDLYLADPKLPSQVGKLVKDDWRKYPALGINLGFIRAGTYSAATRSLSLLYFISDLEQQAFLEYMQEVNPLSMSPEQRLLLLYSLLENDGEVIAALWQRLLDNGGSSFTDRDVGNLLPEIYREIIARHRQRILSADDRDRLLVLEQSAKSIARWRDDEGYAGTSSREHSSRPRVEPYVDLGVLSKADPFKYEYSFSPVGRVWAEAFSSVEKSDEAGQFLSNSFFTVAASACDIAAKSISDPGELVPYLYRAWKAIKSPGGYAPIEEIALVAGIEALLDHQAIIEQATAREALIAYQKANPYDVRFTVNRMGILAHARFLKPPLDSLKAEPR